VKNSKFRTGMKLGRTIYRMHTTNLSNYDPDKDELIGIMDDPDMAELVCVALNEFFERESSSTSRLQEILVSAQEKLRCRSVFRHGDENMGRWDEQPNV
jgi:hypothetical protein